MSSLIDELRKERERFVAFAFAAAEIFFEVDSTGKILFAGGAVEKIASEKPGASHIGNSIHDLIDEDDREVYLALKMHLEHKGRLGPIPLRFKGSQGYNFALRLFGLHMPGEDSRTFIALRSAPLGSGVGEGAVDNETGLLTRDSFLDLAANTMAADGDSSNNLYMTAVEVEGLDEAKKKFGPKFSKNLAGRLAAHLKTISVDGQMAGQIGEKHFAFLHRTQSDGKYIGESLKKVNDKVTLKTAVSTISADGDMSEDQILRTLSYVLTKFCEDSSSVDFEKLDAAYDGMAAEATAKVTDMRTMIESGSFKMAFQPVVSLQTGDIHHNEVLSRFGEHNDNRAPKDVIGFAEEIGMIEEFDIALCRKAIDYVRKMRRLGEPITLAVNLSGRTLESSRFVDEFVNQLVQAKDVARDIMLELTETKAIKNMEKAEAILSDLKAVDYKVCLDDFGAGASGYQYLRAFNVDYVKIDGAYVRDMNTPGYKPTFLLSIVRLCNDLGIRTIGEHVETRFQADFLKSLGVDFGQGFHFGKPEFSPKTNR